MARGLTKKQSSTDYMKRLKHLHVSAKDFVIELKKGSKDMSILTSFARPTMYVLKSGDYYKIGYTKSSIQSRIYGMQTGNPIPIELSLAVATKDCRLLEQVMHNAFQHKRKKGEWFALNEVDLYVMEKAVVNYLASKYEKQS